MQPPCTSLQRHLLLDADHAGHFPKCPLSFSSLFIVRSTWRWLQLRTSSPILPKLRSPVAVQNRVILSEHAVLTSETPIAPPPSVGLVLMDDKITLVVLMNCAILAYSN